MQISKCLAIFSCLSGMTNAADPDTKPCGACVKMPSYDGRGTQYHVRIPKGEMYNDERDILPGKAFQESLKPCNIEEFYAVYDVEGNAHIDFVLKSRNHLFGPNKCNVDAYISDATYGECQVTCKMGPPAMLADEWRNNNN